MASPSTKRQQVFLLGSLSDITGSKLPSIYQVLGFFLHQHLDLKKPKREASASTIDKLLTFWERADIPTRERQHCQTKVEKLFEEWRLLKKNEKRRSGTQVANEENFKESFDDLFDVAHADALTLITISEDREFLLAQREKGRRGTMAGIDVTLDNKNKRKAQRMLKVAAKKQHEVQEQQARSSTVTLASSSSSADESTGGEGVTGAKTPPPPKRGRMTVVTPTLSAALDRTKMSDRKAMMVVTATAQSLGHNVEDMALNRSSIRRLRQKYRTIGAENLKEAFSADQALVVHWDGKLLPELTGKDKVDRLPVLVSGMGTSQLLTVAKLPTGTGKAQADAVVAALRDWGIDSQVQALSFDTTSSNTGRLNGACVLIEQALNRQLLFLACRHHILELIIGAVFIVCMGASSSPEVLVFKRFQAHWEFLDLEKFDDASTDEHVTKALADVRDDIIEFAVAQLSEVQPRDDYREFLELTLIFIGEVPPRGIRFMAPGPMHHARWMSKVIYSLKVWLFRKQFKLKTREAKGLREVAIFSVHEYIKAWMTAPLAACAPYNDLLLMKSLVEYEKINKEVSKTASTKLAAHMWYLSEELVGLALFDRNVPSSVKREMVQSLEIEGEDDAPKRVQMNIPAILASELKDFTTSSSKTMFQKMKLPDDFLVTDPDTWDENDDFNRALLIVQKMKVVNDHAERGVALIQEYSGILTKDEDQLQYLLQIVQEHRKMYPDSKKVTLLKKQ
ncbi:hypothetical protein SNE40_008071 [Patella caerulea]|uniref:Uncharacterized protein n=1 Tax=Patella caerulea TaxID=87958 RepID=A0AAN8K7E7_PATCE